MERVKDIEENMTKSLENHSKFQQQNYVKIAKVLSPLKVTEKEKRVGTIFPGKTIKWRLEDGPIIKLIGSIRDLYVDISPHADNAPRVAKIVTSNITGMHYEMNMENPQIFNNVDDVRQLLSEPNVLILLPDGRLPSPKFLSNKVNMYELGLKVFILQEEEGSFILHQAARLEDLPEEYLVPKEKITTADLDFCEKRGFSKKLLITKSEQIDPYRLKEIKQLLHRKFESHSNGIDPGRFLICSRLVRAGAFAGNGHQKIGQDHFSLQGEKKEIILNCLFPEVQIATFKVWIKLAKTAKQPFNISQFVRSKDKSFFKHLFTGIYGDDHCGWDFM